MFKYIKLFGFAFFILLFISSCTKPQKEFTGKYLTYTNTEAGYEIDYPSEILKPVNNSAEEQIFISDDGRLNLSVFTASLGTNEFNSEFIFNAVSVCEKSESKKFTISEKQMGRDGFILKGYSDDKMFFCQAFSLNENFYTIRFEYDKKDYKIYRDILEHILNSFALTSAAPSQENLKDETLYNEGTLFSFAYSFLSKVYWGNNFNILLKNSSPKLAEFVHPNYGIKRYYNPKAKAILFSSKDNFGFDESTDFSTKPSANKFAGSIPFYNKMPVDGLCKASRDKDGVYCLIVKEIPKAFNSETSVSEKINLPKNYNAILKMVILDKAFIQKTFYFFDIENNWFLLFVDDCDCSA